MQPSAAPRDGLSLGQSQGSGPAAEASDEAWQRTSEGARKSVQNPVTHIYYNTARRQKDLLYVSLLLGQRHQQPAQGQRETIYSVKHLDTAPVQFLKVPAPHLSGGRRWAAPVGLNATTVPQTAKTYRVCKLCPSCPRRFPALPAFGSPADNGRGLLLVGSCSRSGWKPVLFLRRRGDSPCTPISPTTKPSSPTENTLTLPLATGEAHNNIFFSSSNCKQRRGSWNIITWVGICPKAVPSLLFKGRKE